VEQNVAASTQNVAFSALLFLYRDVLHVELPAIENVERAQRLARLPEVFTREETRAVLAHIDGTPRLMASLLYGSGLRLMECVRLRVKDLDFARLQLTVREGKGEKDRVSMLPHSLVEPLRRQLEQTKRLHEEDLAARYGAVYLPYALDRKYPDAAKAWVWQYMFPASRRAADPRSGVTRRHHVAEDVLQRAVLAAVRVGVLHELGDLYRSLGSYEAVLQAYHEARSLATGGGDDDPAAARGRCYLGGRSRTCSRRGGSWTRRCGSGGRRSFRSTSDWGTCGSGR
jgi:integron integrase